jgi:IclR helix-turn-helix domain
LRRPAQGVAEQAGSPAPHAVELSRAQVDGVIRDATRAGNMSVLLSGLADVRDVLGSSPHILDDTRLSRSLLSGLLMLAVMPPDGSYVGNAQLATRLGMSLSTAHRYLTTLVATGLVERDPAMREYRLANAS